MITRKGIYSPVVMEFKNGHTVHIEFEKLGCTIKFKTDIPSFIFKEYYTGDIGSFLYILNTIKKLPKLKPTKTKLEQLREKNALSSKKKVSSR